MEKSTSRGIGEVARLLRKIYSGIVVFLVVGGFILAYFLKPLLLPIVVALLVSMLLRPVQNFLIYKVKLPAIGAALVIIGSALGLLGYGSYLLATPAQVWMEKLPEESKLLQDKLKKIRSPITDMTDQFRNAAEQMATLSEQIQEVGSINVAEDNPKADGTRASQEPMRVEIAESPLTKTMMDYAQNFMSMIASTTVLSVLLLAYGPTMSRRIRLTSDVTDEMLLPAVAREVSRYLGTVTLINICLGITIALALWAYGVPNPILWGLMATVLNFIPYIGALVGAAVVAIVSISTFANQESVLYIIGAPLIYMGITAIEGSFVTPAILGNRFSVNPIMIFVWFVFWSWLWGIPGGLVAVPGLMGVYIIIRGVPEFRKLADAISLKESDETQVEDGMPDTADPAVL